MFQIYELRKTRMKKPTLNRGSGFFKSMHSREELMKIKRARAVKSRKENQKTKEK
jgi:hypothetical protein|tara:strand:- start:331 stop:495 length:165 start_codon:yes stop_codon:yes gene_type:complete